MSNVIFERWKQNMQNMAAGHVSVNALHALQQIIFFTKKYIKGELHLNLNEIVRGLKKAKRKKVIFETPTKS